MNEVLIIIPAFNEEKNIVKLFEKLCVPKIRSFADILVINDGSSDSTENIARSYDVSIITHVFNLGYGSALQVGYKYAVRNNYNYVIQLDADGQHSVDNIAHIYKCLTSKDENGNTPDIVIGSRFLKGSKAYKISPIKRVSIAYFSWLIKLITGEVITDPTSGLQGLSRRAFKYYSEFGNFDYFYPDANMIIQMILLGFRVKETTSIMYERKNGVSMHKGILKQLSYMMIMPLSIWTIVVRVKKKMQKSI
ncbi:glycosyl transferase family 2 [Herbinix hemicellulosilytica]|uniref:Putative membrane protein n=1 Tax=Herbinix hemicellulosilytica TaxID=1564487 RepID=A0A0H5SF75_HERHM|nr:glycosyltransferase family 2 protein [Herbinix hemicellulosilytica]RBP56995.1 glycosyl transferase family 2 [Herbinix hemicellulosilytica]CRZ34132.1 putative membrane protein [Herbinix hemicellulosilytica]